MSFGLFLLFLGEQWVLVTALIVTLWLLYFTEARKAGPALSPQQAISLTNSEGGIFLDIREAKVLSKDILRAQHPCGELANPHGGAECPSRKACDCRVPFGQTSSAAVKQLREKGFDAAHRMAGGMLSWDDNRLPLTK